MTELIQDQIASEREYQNKRHGGFLHDREHSPFEWADFRTEYQRRAHYYFVIGDREAYRRNLIKIAALTVAEMEAYDTQKEIILQGDTVQLELPFDTTLAQEK